MIIKKIKIFNIFLLIILSLVLLGSCGMIKNITSKKRSNSDDSAKLFTFNKFFLEACRQKYIGNYEEALNNYMLAYNVDDTQAAICYEMAVILTYLDDFEGAEVYAKKALDLDKTKNTYYKVLLSYIYKTNNKLPKSAKLMEEVINDYPKEIQFYSGLTNIYIEMNKPNKAIKVLNKAEKQFGVYEEISIQKEKIYKSVGKNKKAIKEAVKLSKAYPTNTRYRAVLAEMYFSDNNEKAAKEVYQALDTMKNKEGIVYFSLAEYYFVKNEMEKAFGYVYDGFESDDVDADTKQKLAFIIIDALNKEGANTVNNFKDEIVQMLDILTNKYPQDINLRLLNADFLFFVEDYKSSSKEYEFVLEKEKANYEAWKRLLYMDFLSNDMQKTYKHSKESVELYPNSIEFYNYFILSSYFLKNYDEVIKAVEHAALLPVPNQSFLIDLLSMQGDAYNALKMYHQSDSVYDKVLNLNNENLTVLNNYSYFLALRNEKLDKALKMSEQLVNLNSKESIFLDTYAWVLYKNNMLDKALKYIDKALQISPSNAVYLEHKGDMLFKLGQEQNALDLWIKAASLGEGSDSLREKIKTKQLIEY